MNPWKSVLAVAVVSTSAAYFAPAASAALIASYNFNDSSNPGFVTDVSGNGHTGALLGTAQFSNDTPPGVGGAGSLLVNTGSVNVQLAGLTSFNSIGIAEAGTVLFWQKAPTNQQTQFGLFNTSARQFQAHAPWSDGTVYFDTGGCCAADQRLTVAQGGDADAWHHWAFVKDGNNKFIYRDGTLLQSQIGTATAAMNDVIDEVRIGSETAGGNPMTGRMDEVAFYDNALSQTQIQSIMTNGVPVPEPTSLCLLGMGAAMLIRRRR